MSENRLTSLPANVFSDLKSLKELNLWGNEIEVVEEGTFAGLVSLQELWISENRIKSIAANAFHELRALEKLLMYKNEIEEIDERLFSRLESLKRLDISRNRIKSLPLKTFNGLVKLEKLNLEEELDNNELYAHLTNLTYVNENRIYCAFL
jgi:Leucine-rich repeat (LRR) protein